MAEDRYVVNINEGALDVVHRNPREECNLDDTDRRQTIDPDTADALLTMGDARKCQHCWLEGQTS